jgi:long-chain-acyl-CoA dehydrogenase
VHLNYLANEQEEKLTAEMASMAKYWCTDVENKVADECLQLHGGYGYMWFVVRVHCGVDRIIRDSVSSTLYFAFFSLLITVFIIIDVFLREYPISRAFVDARVQRIYGGANEIMKELISRSI